MGWTWLIWQLICRLKWFGWMGLYLENYKKVLKVEIYDNYNCYYQHSFVAFHTWERYNVHVCILGHFMIIPWLKKIIWVIGVLRRTLVSDRHFDNLCGSHLQSQVVVLVSWKFKNPGEQFDWSVDRVAIGKCVMWLAVKTCAEIIYFLLLLFRWSS